MSRPGETMFLLLLACTTEPTPDSDGPPIGDTGDADCDLLTFFADADGDGFGDPGSPVEACEAPEGHVEDDTDCDDQRADVNPGATGEVCEDLDCSGALDSGAQWVPQDMATLAEATSELVCVDAGEHVADLDVPGTLRVVGVGPESVLVSTGGPTFRVTGDLTVSNVTARGAHRVFDVEGGSLTLSSVVVDDAGCLDDDDCYGTVLRVQEGSIQADGLDISGIDLDAQNDVQGVVLYSWQSDVQLADLSVTDVHASSTNTVAWIDARNSTLQLDGARISGSTLHTSASSVAGFSTRQTDATYRGLILAGNTLTADEGGYTYGLFMHGGGEVVIDHADIVDNELDAYIYSGGFAYVNNWYGDGAFTLTNSNVVDLALGNGTPGEAEAFIVSWDAPVELAWNNVVAVNYPVAWINDTQVDASAELSADPLYVDTSGEPAGWDLHLTDGSPSQDAGDPGARDADGTRADIGAYGG